MDIFINIALMCGLITLVLMSPVCMNIGLVKVSNGDYKISKKELTLCCIPVFNHFFGNIRYYGNAFSIAGISSIFMYLMIIVRTVVMFAFFENTGLQVATVYMFLASVLIFWVCNAISIFRILTDSGMYTITSRIVNAFSVVIGHITVGFYMPKKLKYYTKKKGSLNGRR